MTHTRPTQEKVLLGPTGSKLADVVDVARYGVEIELTDEALEAVAAVRRHVEDLAAGEVPALTLKLRPGEDVLEAARTLVEDLKLASEAAGRSAAPADG